MDKKRQTSRQTGNDREGVYRDRNRQTCKDASCKEADGWTKTTGRQTGSQTVR